MKWLGWFFACGALSACVHVAMFFAIAFVKGDSLGPRVLVFAAAFGFFEGARIFFLALSIAWFVKFLTEEFF